MIYRSSLAWGLFWLSMTYGSTAFADFQDMKNKWEEQEASVKAQCEELEKVAYPKSDKPTAAQESSLKNCDAESFYYGINGKVDYLKARLCALSTQSEQGLTTPSGILMMLYANGQGVNRNYTLAKKAACNTWAAPAEMIGRMEHLADMESAEKGLNPKIDICDDITSGMMQGVCASIGSRLADQIREKKLAKITSGWNPKEKAAFDNLGMKAKDFINLRSDKEVDQTGTARVAMIVYEYSSLKDDFLKSIDNFEAGELPTFTKNDYAVADRELNRIYGQLEKAPRSEYDTTTVTMKGIQQVQRAWISYRDAWVSFGKIKYPAVPDYAWKTYFTIKRTEMLSKPSGM